MKTVANPILSVDTVTRSQGKERVKTFESADRDANGKQEQPDHHEPEKEFEQEELEELVAKLKRLPAVEQGGLIVKLKDVGSGMRVLIESPTGEVIRTLSPTEAWQATINIDKDTPKGQLLNKAM